MKLSSIKSNFQTNNSISNSTSYSKSQSEYSHFKDVHSNLAPLQKDTITFGISMYKAVRDTIKEFRNGTKWVTIPSMKNDYEHYKKNCLVLEELDLPITRQAKYQLAQGDVQIYYQDGKRKILLTFNDDNVYEAISPKHGEHLNPDEYEIVKKHISDKNYKLSELAKNEEKYYSELAQNVQIIKTDLKDAIKNKDSETIFNYVGIETKKTPDGKLIISEYKQPTTPYNCFYEDLGIDENWLLKDVIEIEGFANFEFSNATDIRGIKHIGHHAYINRCQLTRADFKHVKIDGDLIGK